MLQSFLNSSIFFMTPMQWKQQAGKTGGSGIKDNWKEWLSPEAVNMQQLSCSQVMQNAEKY
jgi:hypothetical protein